ncbi:hypothetical protein [Actinomadura pelletieri]|uniref:hypothetical protein n=1 Tax=Actinomadura pelletieri TaxID=111805 RepID=UPI0011C43A25|nr:hypothetical protein [Actinomadura pelletieri]
MDTVDGQPVIDVFAGQRTCLGRVGIEPPTFRFRVKAPGRHAKLAVSSDGAGIVGQAGGGADRNAPGHWARPVARWRRPRAIHDPGKVVADLAMMLALGGD